LTICLSTWACFGNDFETVFFSAGNKRDLARKRKRKEEAAEKKRKAEDAKASKVANKKPKAASRKKGQRDEGGDSAEERVPRKRKVSAAARVRGQFAETDPMIIQQGSQLGPNFRTPIATSMKCFVELVVDTNKPVILRCKKGPVKKVLQKSIQTDGSEEEEKLKKDFCNSTAKAFSAVQTSVAESLKKVDNAARKNSSVLQPDDVSHMLSFDFMLNSLLCQKSKEKELRAGGGDDDVWLMDRSKLIAEVMKLQLGCSRG